MHDSIDEHMCVSEDKYVYLDRSINIKCHYNYKFKRWVPISLASENDKINLLTQIQNKI